MALHTEDEELEQVGHWCASPLPPAAATTGKCSFSSSRSNADRESARQHQQTLLQMQASIETLEV